MAVNEYASCADRSCLVLCTSLSWQAAGSCSCWYLVCSGLGIYDMKLGEQEVLEGRAVKKKARTIHTPLDGKWKSKTFLDQTEGRSQVDALV